MYGAHDSPNTTYDNARNYLVVALAPEDADQVTLFRVAGGADFLQFLRGEEFFDSGLESLLVLDCGHTSHTIALGGVCKFCNLLFGVFGASLNGNTEHQFRFVEQWTAVTLHRNEPYN